MRNCSQPPRCSICSGSNLRWFFRKNAFDFYDCAECRHVRVFPYPTEEQTRAHYEQGFTESYLSQNKAWFQVLAERRMQILRNHFGDDFRGCLLDVGSGFGFFLKQAERAGWSVQGIETSPIEATYSTTQLSLPVLNKDVSQAIESLPSNSFDVVSFWHVLEHLEEPGSAIREATRLLRPSGVLALNSPNLDSGVFRLLGHRWSWIYVPGHLQYFRVKPFAEWLRQEGLTVQSLETWTHAPNLYFMLEEALLLATAECLGTGTLGRKIGGKIRNFVYGVYHQQVIQRRFRHLYRLTPYLDRYLLSRFLGHEFLILASKQAPPCAHLS